MAEQTKNSEALDSILDGTLDDLADLPSFKPYPAGAHRVNIKWSFKDVNKKPAVQLNFSAIATEELAEQNNPEIKPLEKGDETQVLYILKNNDGSVNEIAQGKLKEIAKVLKEKFPGNSLKEILIASNDAECIVVTTIKENKKNDPSTFNTDVQTLVVV